MYCDYLCGISHFLLVVPQEKYEEVASKATVHLRVSIFKSSISWLLESKYDGSLYLPIELMRSLRATG